MRLFFTLVSSIFLLGLGITGCVAVNSKTAWFNQSITERRWADAFMWYSNVLYSGTEAEKEKITSTAKKYPEIARAGIEEFSEASIKKQISEKNQLDADVWSKVNALCMLVPEEQCKAVQERVGNTVSNIKPRALVLTVAFEKLKTKEQETMREQYDLEYYENDTTGKITERQVQDISKAGSTAGSEIGSSLASAIYINNAIPRASYNMWTDIAVGVLGGVAGAGGNQAPVQQYIINYTVRTLSNQLKSRDVRQGSPIGEPIGACFDLSQGKAIDEGLCSMTADDIRKKYLTD